MGLWSRPGPAATRFSERRADPRRQEAVLRLLEATRERFMLEESDLVLVSEDSSGTPGFPPLETRVHFQGADGVPHHFRVFKPVSEVIPEDIPPAWLRASLAHGAPDCDCC